MNAPIRTAEEAIEAAAIIARSHTTSTVSLVVASIATKIEALATRITQPDRETIARALSASRYGHAIDDERHVSDGERLSLYRDADAVLAAIGGEV